MLHHCLLLSSSGQTANQRNPFSHSQCGSVVYVPVDAPLFPPQVDGGQRSDATLDDSDLEARLNSWNLGVSLWACPGAPPLSGCSSVAVNPRPGVDLLSS